MRNIFLIALTILLAFILMRTSHSQSFFFNTPKTNPAQPPNTSSVPLSTQDFKNRVDNLSKQSSEALSKDVSGVLTKPPIPPIPNMPAGSKPAQPANMPPPVQPTGPTTPPPATEPAQEAPATAPYTGFQSNPPSKTNQNQKSDNWNIQY